MLLGAIADDLTGATDLALMLTRGGMRTVQVMDVPTSSRGLDAFDAVVVALKSRTNPPEEAVAWSLASADALLALGAEQLFFKYCSTFDSTDRGNIGPVAQALVDKLGGGLTLATPAFPRTGRTVYQSNLFVNGVPLAESPMKDHPLTPMRDSNLKRVLQRQTALPVGAIVYETIAEGSNAIAKAFAQAEAGGDRILIVDAIADADLMEIGRAADGMRLVTGGSGVAMGLPQNFARRGRLKPAPVPTAITAPKGRRAILAGSCSVATRGQVERAIAAGLPVLRIDPMAVVRAETTPDTVAAWAVKQSEVQPVLVYSSADPETVAAAQAALGREKAGTVVEDLLAAVAEKLVAAGTTGLIVAGGETSGAVVNRLGIAALEIGPEIDPGVPWCRAVGRDLVVALKSGNFGAPDFFLKAWEQLA